MPAPAPRPTYSPQPVPGLGPSPSPPPGQSLGPASIEIKSAEVSTLTSPGLGELKRLINEAAIKRRQLAAAVAADRCKLEDATRKLHFAQSFIVRIFTQKSLPRLAHAVETAQDTLDTRTAELEGCVIEVDFAFDDASHGSYAALIRSFEALSACQRIWDVTAVQATNQYRERTVATTSLTRTPVSFDFAVPEIVKSSQQAMRMGNASGRYVHLYPGFLMMRDDSGDFALIEYNELEADFSQSRFIEEESVPSDTEVIGQTWKKANKDGSPDRRFKDNYSIPIVRYAELVLRSPTGLFEAYQFSDFGKTNTFHQALSNHQRTLAALAKKGGVTVANDPEPEDHAEWEEHDDVAPQAQAAPAPPNVVMDWIVLAAGIVALGLGFIWAAHQAPSAVSATPPPAVASPAPPPAPPKAAHKHRKKSHHSAAAALSTGQSADQGAAVTHALPSKRTA